MISTAKAYLIVFIESVKAR